MMSKLVIDPNMGVYLAQQGISICLASQFHKTQLGYCVCMGIDCDIPHDWIGKKVFDIIYV